MSTHGLMAEFDREDQLLEAARRAYAEGYRDLDAYSPVSIEGLAEAIGFRTNRLWMFVLAGGVIGAAGGFFMETYASVWDYPWNVGGRPLFSWPAFLPVTFELAVLGAALATVLGLLLLCGLPQPHHPVFEAPEFDLASRNRFFLCLERRDPLFDPKETRRFLESLAPRKVFDVGR